MTRARWLGTAVGGLLVAILLAACGSGSDRALRTTLAALATPGPVAPAAAPSTPSPRCTNLTASLSPPATMPPPGAMPPGSTMARILKRGYLLAGVDQNTLLFAYLNPLDGQLEGFEIDVLRQIAKAIFGDPNAIRFKAVTTAERIPAVEDGSVDLVADAITITCERRTEVEFSTVYYDAKQRLLVPVNSPITGLSSLGGKTVCATIGSTTIATVAALRPHPSPYPVQQRTDCLVALQQGLVDAISSDDAILLGFKAQDPFTKIIGPSLADEPYGIAINRSDPDFVRFVNGVLAQMRSDGTWRAIYQHWLSRYTGGTIPAPPQARYDG